jgi:hypothetical protein
MMNTIGYVVMGAVSFILFIGCLLLCIKIKMVSRPKKDPVSVKPPNEGKDSVIDLEDASNVGQNIPTVSDKCFDFYICS